MITLDTYSEYEDGSRTMKTPDVEYRITLDRSTGLWSIGTDTGKTPYDLRGLYTSSMHAAQAVQDYQANAPARKAIYAKPKKEV